jgi:hypothetical protein
MLKLFKGKADRERFTAVSIDGKTTKFRKPMTIWEGLAEVHRQKR